MGLPKDACPNVGARLKEFPEDEEEPKAEPKAFENVALPPKTLDDPNGEGAAEFPPKILEDCGFCCWAENEF